MFRRKPETDDYPPFAALPVSYFTTAMCRRVATHVSGDFARGMPPLVCLAGYNRNMLDYAALMTEVRGMTGIDWPFVLIDLPGRGRSSPASSVHDYSTLTDAGVVGDVLAALNIHSAIFVGQGHGGQIIMALSLSRICLIRAAILIDAGPVADPRGLVRLRNNLEHLSAFHGTSEEAENTLVQLHANDYPGLDKSAVLEISTRTHRITPKGRIHALYDKTLGQKLADFTADDVLEPQWQMFAALSHIPLVLMRTQYTDLLRRETFDQMARQRPDAVTLSIPGEGSPALLTGPEELGIVTAFLDHLTITDAQLGHAA